MKEKVQSSHPSDNKACSCSRKTDIHASTGTSLKDTRAQTDSIRIVTSVFARNQKGEKRDQVDWILNENIKHIPITVYLADDVANKETKTWGDPAPWRNIIPKRAEESGIGKVTIEPMINEFTMGEGPAFLHFIIENYDHLPDVTIFLHGVPTAHNQHIYEDIKQLSTWPARKIAFMHLNPQWYKDGAELHRFLDKGNTYHDFDRCYHFTKSIGYLLEDGDPNFIPYINVWCCAQFAVTRERIQRLPKYFWKLVLKNSKDYGDGVCLEHLWHVFLGEAPIMERTRLAFHWLERMQKENAGVELLPDYAVSGVDNTLLNIWNLPRETPNATWQGIQVHEILDGYQYN